MTIHELATNTDFHIDLKRNSGEEQMVCPKCSHLRKKKTIKCFSWNIDKNVGRCNHCESSFIVKEERMQTKQYFRPEFNNKTELSNNAVKWFQARAISQNTLNHFKITYAKSRHFGLN